MSEKPTNEADRRGGRRTSASRRGADEAAERGRPRTSTSSAAAKQERDEYLELAQRTKADFDNYRKRVAAEAHAAAARGKAELARELIPVLDNLERAVARPGTDPERPAMRRARRSPPERSRRASPWSCASCARRSSAPASRPMTRPARGSTPPGTRPCRPGPARGPAGHGAGDTRARLPPRRPGAAPRPRGRERVGGAMARRATSTRCWGSPARPPRTRSRRPTANWPASGTPTATPMTPMPRSASRRSSRPTTRSRIPRSASSTTPAASSVASAPGRGGARGLPGRRLRLGPRRHLLDLLQPRWRRPAGPRPSAGRDLETEVQLASTRRCAAPRSRSRCRPPAPARPAGAPAPSPDLPEGLPPLRGPRRGHREPGLLLDLSSRAPSAAAGAR